MAVVLVNELQQEQLDLAECVNSRSRTEETFDDFFIKKVIQPFLNTFVDVAASISSGK